MYDHQRVLRLLKGGVVRSCPVWLDHVSILDLEKITSKLHHCYISGLRMWHLFGSGKKKNWRMNLSCKVIDLHSLIYPVHLSILSANKWEGGLEVYEGDNRGTDLISAGSKITTCTGARKTEIWELWYKITNPFNAWGAQWKEPEWLPRGDNSTKPGIRMSHLISIRDPGNQR